AKRLAIVGGLSSAARMPRPGATSARAIDSSSVLPIVGLLPPGRRAEPRSGGAAPRPSAPPHLALDRALEHDRVVVGGVAAAEEERHGPRARRARERGEGDPVR